MKKSLTILALFFLLTSSFAQLPVSSGNVLWLKADAGAYNNAGTTLATNGQAVQQWNDQSGSNNHASQATGPLKPTFVTNVINGQPVVRFSSNMLVTPSINLTSTDKLDMYVVYKSFNLNGTWECIAEEGPDYNTTAGFTFFDNAQTLAYGGMYVGHSGNNYNTKNYPFKADVFKVVNTSMDRGAAAANEINLRINGVDCSLLSQNFGNDNSGNYFNQPIYIGNRGAAVNSYPLIGDIAEIILYNRKLTAPEKVQIETYLNAKYNIQCNVSTPKPGSGGCLAMNSSGTYGAYAQDGADIDFGSNDFTMETWVMKRANTSGYYNNAIFNKWNTGAAPGTNEFSLSSSTDGLSNNIPSFAIEVGSSYYQVNATTNMVINKWYHIAAVRNGNNLLMYVNGILEGTQAIPPGTSINNVAARNTLQFGYIAAGYQNASNLDEVRIWNTAVSQTNLRDWMCKKVTASHPNYNLLTRYYRFDEPTGSTIFGNQINNCATEVFNYGSTIVTSGAPIGDVSANNYATNNASANINFGTPSDNLSATMNAGTSTGVHVYGVNELPNNTNGLPSIATNNKYAGVYVVGGNASAAYNVTYNYTNNNTITSSIEADLVLFKRIDNSATNWNKVISQTLNSTTRTITATGQNTEYSLATVPYLNPPTCGIKLTAASNEGVNIPYNTALNLTNNYTYEAWIKPSTDVSQYRTIIGRGFYPSYKPALYVNGIADGTPGKFSGSFFIGGVYKSVISTSTVNDNQWHHVATTYDGANMKIYVDGVLENTVAATGTLATSTEPMGIGYNYTANNYGFIGTIDEVRIWNTARTLTELKTAMNNSLVGTETGLVAYYNFNNNNRSGQNRIVSNFCNATGANLTGLTTGTALVPSFECAPPPFTTPECNMQMNGTTDWAQAPYNAAINLSQFSVGSYFKTTNTSTTKNIVFKDVDGTYLSSNYQLGITATNKAQVSFTNTVGATITAVGTTTVTDGNWHYTVGTYDGTNLKIYVDGVLEGSTANNTTPLTGTFALDIGCDNGATFKFIGSLDEVSVWNTALSLSQIQGFIGQRLEGNEPNLVAYYNFAGNKINGNGVTILNSCTATSTALNAITAGTTTTPIFTCSEILPTPPTCSILMNGLNDYAVSNVTSGIGYPTVTQNFTMEVVAKPLLPKNGSSPNGLRVFPLGHYIENAGIGQRFVISPDNAGDGFAYGHAGVGIALGTNGISVYELSSGYGPGRINLNSAVVDDWVHLTVVSENGVLKLYVNGALSGSASASGYILHPSASISNNYGAFAGYVGEVRVWNVAKTSDQIRLGINTNLVGSEANLVSLYKFGNNTTNGDAKIIPALGSNTTGLRTYGSLNSPIFTCSNDVTVKRDSVVGSGNVLTLNGTAQFAELGNLGNIPAQGSLMAWFNATTLKDKAIVFTTNHFRNKKGRYNGINLFTRADGRLQLTFGKDTTDIGFQDTVTVTNNIAINRWYHFAMSWDTVAKTYTAYVNGILTATGTTNYWPTQLESFKAGMGVIQDAAYAWHGYVDEISEWNKILSLTEIRNQMSSKINTTQSNYNNVLHYYRFDNNGNNANTINDYKGTSHGAFFSSDLGCISFPLTSPPFDCYYGSYNYPFVTSSAPIGDTSRYDYSGVGSFAKVVTGIANRDTLSATVLTGSNVQGVHVYGVNEKPNTQNGQIALANNDRYGGVFVVGDTNQLSYDFKYKYNLNPNMLPTNNHDQLLLYKRNHNADGTWVLDFTATIDSINKTYSTVSRNAEFMLGYSPLPVRPHLGNDTIAYVVCEADTRRIDTLYKTLGFTTNWTTNPLAAPIGNWRLIATSSLGFTDTAFVQVKQDVQVWTGAVSNDWHNPANWNVPKVPTVVTHVIIPNGTLYACIISTADAEAASVQVNAGNLNVMNSRHLFIAAKCPTLPFP